MVIFILIGEWGKRENWAWFFHRRLKGGQQKGYTNPINIIKIKYLNTNEVL